jgi:type IV secretion system protein VirB9
MKYFFTFFIIIFSVNIFAFVESRPIGHDSRIRVMVYNKDDVFKFVGHYGFQSTIELGKGETVVSISMGDTTSWQIIPSGNGNMITLKPIEKDATTNMMLITNKRSYIFELHAEEAYDIRDPNLVFNLRFIYPGEEGSDDDLKTYSAAIATPVDLKHPEKYNFNYSISGDETIAPIKIFDDGEFTYLQFRDKNSELPAIFAVDDALREAMVNYRLSQEDTNLVIVEQVFKKLSIRHGKKIVCVFNEAFIPY